MNDDIPWKSLKRQRTMQRRTREPAWLAKPHDDTDNLWGTQAEWGWALPWLWAYLTDVRTPLLAPAAPDAKSTLTGACGYWTPLLHLMRFGLGWRTPEIGLAAWLDHGRPTTCRPLQVINDIWARDGQLEWLMVWLIESSQGAMWAGFEQWAAQQRRDAGASDAPNPLIGGTDPLHLGHHGATPAFARRDGGVSESQLTITRESSESTAILMLDSTSSWYEALTSAGGDLDARGQDWTVQVMSRGLGWMGRWVRSTETESWYLAGPEVEYWHLAGQ